MELTEILSDAEVSVNDAIQVPMTGRGPLVLLAADSGLIAWNTTDGITSAGSPWWVFDIEDAETFVRMAIFSMNQNPQSLTCLNQLGHFFKMVVLEEITGVWMGTAGGLHLIDLSLFIQMPRSSIINDRMFNSERWSKEPMTFILYWQ